MDGIPLTGFLPLPHFDLQKSLNKWGVRTEKQLYTEQAQNFTAFAMSSHSRLGKDCTWLTQFPPELHRKIFATLTQITGCACASPCPISAIEDRIDQWRLVFYASETKVHMWAQIIELQRVLNRCWEKGSVVFTTPTDEILSQHKATWWLVMSWLGWLEMRVLDPRSLHDELTTMVNTNSKLWKYMNNIPSLLDRLCIERTGRRLPDDKIHAFEFKYLVRYEDWSFSQNYPLMDISSE